MLNIWIYFESESLTQRIKIPRSILQIKIYESTERFAIWQSHQRSQSDGHGEILPNPTQVYFQEPPQENSEVTGL
jgi:hypothetical protein